LEVDARPAAHLRQLRAEDRAEDVGGAVVQDIAAAGDLAR
jgi:hypothetical protein